MLALLVSLLWAVGAGAQTLPPWPMAEPDKAAVRQIIQQQLDAFKRDDGPAAFGFAAPLIQGMFGTPERFMGMVREGYKPVYRPREVEFRDMVELHGHPAQRVLIVGPDGRPVVAYYTMEQQPDGTWRIAGCILMDAEDETT